MAILIDILNYGISSNNYIMIMTIFIFFKNIIWVRSTVIVWKIKIKNKKIFNKN